MADRDEDDWVGEPPEGHYTRDRAKPEFWRTQRPVQAMGLGMLVIIVILVVVILTH